MTLRISFVSVLVLLVLGVVQSAHAHALGASFEAQVGEYLVDIGYDPDPPVAEDTLLLDLNLWREQNVSSADFDSAWVRLEQGGKTILATGVARPEFGPMTVLLKLPSEPGEAKLHVRFERKATTDWVVADTSFDFVIAPSPEAPHPPIVWGIVGFVVAACAMLAVWYFGPSQRKRIVSDTL